ncbi:Mpo1-like protein [Rhodoblastus sp.]|uniref:Mpo1 family 2-hydroxy fatty acid dioxygenase n=1 Tax=Rhodoblastus sp. TaxID=1962975 RepID=UPI00262AD2D7|nr:Mpo1-like protein [Rhodoblastus sp.]
MRSLVDVLSHYAAYHRDPRNIATHFVGIPLIVVAVAVLLGRPALLAGGVSLTPALAIAAVAAAYYLKLDVVLGALMAFPLLLAAILGAWAGALPTREWLLAGSSTFVAGWIIQFIGHAWEGRKPAFADDLIGLAIGPLFVLCELLFAVGLRPELKRAVESRVGPARRGTARSRA